MRVRVDLNLCTGHALCYSVAPDVFDLDDTGHCLLTAADVPRDREQKAEAGAAACPERAITLVH
jgi:ferredoxin